MSTELRRLGRSDLHVTPLALGCWPITGVTSLDVSEQQSLATLAACLDAGINFLDTAFFYGRDGESERYIARALGHCRERFVIATKGGLHWRADGSQGRDASPATLRRECEESLRRLNTDYVDLLYLHAADPATPLAETAAGLRALQEAGKTRAVGVCNLTLSQIREFHAVCPLAAVQLPYNLIQREVEAEILPWCRSAGVAFCAYWPLMKGLFAGHLPRDFVFRAGDGRAKYPMFQGQEWLKNQDLVDALRPIAAAAGRSVAQLTLQWTISQPGVTAALVGAKRPEQLRENAGGMGWTLTTDQQAQIAAALAARGTPQSQPAVT